VTNFGSRAEAAALCAANKRIHNILKKTRPSKDVVFDSTLLKESAEKELAAAVARCTDEISTMLDKRAFDAALTLLAGLKEPIDRFFDDVMVMVDDIQQRNNRLLLLLQTRQLFLRIADVSRLNYPVNPH